MLRSFWKSGFVLLPVALGFALPAMGQDPLKDAVNPPAGKVVKSDAEWRRILTPQQYAVTRQADTEPAGSGKLLRNHEKGVYECVCCSNPLFSSKTKFESGTGWPSFDAPIATTNVATATDYKLGYPRTEVTCSKCGAHLGHVFDDGPTKTGMRFCMNSVALKFAKDAPPVAATPAKPGAKVEPVKPTPK